MFALNVMWPALFIGRELESFWFVVFGTIAIELFVIHYVLKHTWKKSFFMTTVGNIVSGLVGMFLMQYLMAIWELTGSQLFGFLFGGGSFSHSNWVASFVLMCLGSVFFETLTVKLIYKETIKKLYLPLLAGNVLSYIFIASIMIIHSKAPNL